jgi:hypothetical protein
VAGNGYPASARTHKIYVRNTETNEKGERYRERAKPCRVSIASSRPLYLPHSLAPLPTSRTDQRDT